MIKTIPIKVTTVGSAGAAAGTGRSEGVVRGEILGAYFNFHASAPATTDTTLRTAGQAAPSYNIVAIANSVTDAFLAPRAKPVDSANAAITNAHAPFVVHDVLEVALAECDALTDAVVVHVLVRE